jgi:hypothetical protein
MQCLTTRAPAIVVKRVAPLVRLARVLVNSSPKVLRVVMVLEYLVRVFLRRLLQEVVIPFLSALLRVVREELPRITALAGLQILVSSVR